MPRKVAALSGDGEGHSIPAPVRKQKVAKSKGDLVKEAVEVRKQLKQIDCISSPKGNIPPKFYTLPARKKNKQPPEFANSLGRRRRAPDSDLSITPPKKPPRTFASTVFQNDTKPKKSNLRRSISDVSSSASYKDGGRYRTTSEGDETSSTLKRSNKKQLSPIIEVNPREDYFQASGQNSKENDKNVDNFIQPPARKKRQSVTEKLKEFIDEIDSELYSSEPGGKISPSPSSKIHNSEVIIIDVDKAEKISATPKLSLTKKIQKAISGKRKNKPKDKERTKVLEIRRPKESSANLESSESKSGSVIVQEAIANLQSSSQTMIHSSQQPVDKLPLTKGRTVDSMVKRLSHESSSPPPKTNIMITPNVSVQHNNNQPFSYTRGLSPDRSPTSPTSPIIYAQVVCSNGSGGKQTVHTAYTNGKKHMPHSDSDEGLGYEENSAFQKNFRNEKYKSDYFNNSDKEEYPITPKFQNTAYNGYSYENKGLFIDSSSRGRGDGIEAKRRESLSEAVENGFGNKFSNTSTNTRMDLSARRDLLESRITRRFGEVRGSPEFPSKPYLSDSPRYQQRSGSDSPLGVRDKIGVKLDRHGNHYVARDYRYAFDGEPKSFDSQASDYRSSPENRHFETSHNKYSTKVDKLSKDRSFYKSNPEIHLRSYNYDDHRRYQDSYHDSLKREKRDAKDCYFQTNERKDKFGDSGIENDSRRDSSDRRYKRRELSNNESEDEGFASSLLIASERQHIEKSRPGYDSDRGYNRDEDYRNLEPMEYKMYKQSKNEYVPRERSIDDGSHFDPRIDKNLTEKGNLKKVDKKPPKPEKKSSLEKMKQLFSGSKKKKEKPGMVREEILRARYTEYKGNGIFKNYGGDNNELGYDYNNRRRLSSPGGSPTREDGQRKNEPTHGSWFKSLDRLSRKKSKKGEKEGNLTSTEDEITKPTKSLRFFGDTDQESNDSTRRNHKSALKSRSAFASRTRSQSSRDLHNISEETQHRKAYHKSLLNINNADSDRDVKGLSLKPPASPAHRNRDKLRDDRGTSRRKNEVSSIGSSTEGDSSQQSQRSVVYLHAATVGDIPGPGYLRNGRRAASREELTSNASGRMQPHVKTLSRSFSVLAPWRPKYYKEGMDIDYTQYPKPLKNGKFEQNRHSSSRKESSTLKKKAQETRRSNQNVSTLSNSNKRSHSKENISSLKRAGDMKSSTSSLYKKKERQPKENINRYNRGDEKMRMASKSMSVESLGSNRSGKRNEVSRSVSMPRDPEKSAGWFNMKKKKSVSSHRL